MYNHVSQCRIVRPQSCTCKRPHNGPSYVTVDLLNMGPLGGHDKTKLSIRGQGASAHTAEPPINNHWSKITAPWQPHHPSPDHHQHQPPRSVPHPLQTRKTPKHWEAKREHPPPALLFLLPCLFPPRIFTGSSLLNISGHAPSLGRIARARAITLHSCVTYPSGRWMDTDVVILCIAKYVQHR